MKKVVSFIVLMLLGSVGFSGEQEVSLMKANLSQAMRCQLDSRNEKSNEIVSSVECYNRLFWPQLSSAEKAGFINWFNSVKSVEKVWDCHGKRYQLKSFHSYTNNFICVDIINKEEKQESKVFFFIKKKKTYYISTIYTPFEWH